MQPSAEQARQRRYWLLPAYLWERDGRTSALADLQAWLNVGLWPLNDMNTPLPEGETPHADDYVCFHVARGPKKDQGMYATARVASGSPRLLHAEEVPSTLRGVRDYNPQRYVIQLDDIQECLGRLRITPHVVKRLDAHRQPTLEKQWWRVYQAIANPLSRDEYETLTGRSGV